MPSLVITKFLSLRRTKKKPSFVIDTNLYCYNVMPFGLKDVGATYQHLVNKVSETLIGKTMEVYVDDLITKSVKEIDHVRDL